MTDSFFPAFGPATIADVKSGDTGALLRALTALAASWAQAADVAIAAIDAYGPTACLAQKDVGVPVRWVHLIGAVDIMNADAPDARAVRDAGCQHG